MEKYAKCLSFKVWLVKFYLKTEIFQINDDVNKYWNDKIKNKVNKKYYTIFWEGFPTPFTKIIITLKISHILYTTSDNCCHLFFFFLNFIPAVYKKLNRKETTFNIFRNIIKMMIRKMNEKLCKCLLRRYNLEFAL